MIWKICLMVAVAVSCVQFTESVSEEAMVLCHTGYRDGTGRCKEYANVAKRSVREAAKARLVKRQTSDMESPPDCDTLPADLQETCEKCESGELTGDDCLPPDQDGQDGGDGEGGDGGDGMGPPDCDTLPADLQETCEKCESGELTGDDCIPPDQDGGGMDDNGNLDVDFPELDEGCLDVVWGTGWENTAENNYGNCMANKTDETHRYISSNNVPDFYYNPYCPIGLGQGYCVEQEYESDSCFFVGMLCGAENMGEGTTAFGDVWVAQEDNYYIKLEGNPTLQDRPADMYDATGVDAGKTTGTAVGVAINGIGIYGPNDAGDVSIDEAGFQLACGGHVTPPEGNENVTGASTPPKYHYHKAMECLQPFQDAAMGLAAGGTPQNHAGLIGWALDGFGIYAYQDWGGVTPVVDECGGHFGAVDTGEVVYHYHARAIVPYTIACQGPALGKCDDTQRGVNYCHYGCGADICVQPGTDPVALREYLDKFNSTWLDSYTVNDYILEPEQEEESDRDESDRDESDRDESDRDESDRDESDRDESDRDESDRDESDRDESDRDESGRDGSDRDESGRDESGRDGSDRGRPDREGRPKRRRKQKKQRIMQ